MERKENCCRYLRPAGHVLSLVLKLRPTLAGTRTFGVTFWWTAVTLLGFVQVSSRFPSNSEEFIL